MKRIIKMTVLSLLPAAAFAVGGAHPMAGCGLGYLLLSNSDPTKGTQILGATTNGTGIQTFGITSGTSGCTEDGAVKLARAAEVFVEVNLVQLRRDIAVGHGEYVDTFASLVGAPDSRKGEMVQFLHTEYPSLFPTAETQSDEMLKTLAEKLSQHPELLG
jgi:hypothetical protein